MKNYIDYKKELDGLDNVLLTVRTMEKIAASRIRAVRESVRNLATYNAEIERTISALGGISASKENGLFKGNKQGDRMLVVISGNKGLVGSLWHDLINIAMTRVHEYRFVVIVGKKADNYIREEQTVADPMVIPIGDIPSDVDISRIGAYMIDEFKKGYLAGIDIAYPRFISLVSHEAVIVPFLPFRFVIDDASSEIVKKHISAGIPIIEPSRQSIINGLIEKYIEAYISKIIFEANLSELSARTVTMEHATEKTRDVIKKIGRDYSKQRMRALTQKQIESFTAHKFR